MLYNINKSGFILPFINYCLYLQKKTMNKPPSYEYLYWCYQSLTDAQQDIASVKYHIVKNMDKTNKELQIEIENLEVNYKVVLSVDRIRKIKKYEIPVILDKY